MKKRGPIGAYLDVLLAERGMRQNDLAERSGVSCAYISEIFMGRKNLGPVSIPKIAAAIEPSKQKRLAIENRLYWLAAVDAGYVVAEVVP